MQISEKYEVCVAGLREFAQSIHASEFVIGLSGGLDSSVVAALAVDVFGAERIHGVLMPGPYSTGHSVTDAQDLAARLGVQTWEAPIKKPFAAFQEAYLEAFGQELTGLAAENTQARCRMIYLMALSNAHGWMLINTGNKSEAMMGYSTLYGDTAGSYAPIGGLYKTDVFALASWLNERAELQGQVAPIPQHVISKPPSAELSAGQEDERSLGVTYEVLDQILMRLMDQGMAADQVINQGYAADDVQYIERRVKSYAFKRALEPPYPGEDFYK